MSRPPKLQDTRLWAEDRHMARARRRTNTRELITEALDDLDDLDPVGIRSTRYPSSRAVAAGVLATKAHEHTP